MQTPTVKTDKSRFLIPFILACWLVAFGLGALGCVFAMSDAKTLGGWFMSAVGFGGNLFFLGAGLTATSCYILNDSTPEDVK